MSGHLGDYAVSTVIYGKFTTYRPTTGAAYTLAGTPALSVYKDNSTTQSTTGVTLTVDFDSVTGLHHFAIDTSADGTFYSAGSNFDIVITTGTVDSVSVVGTVVGSFSLAKTASLKPTTAGRTLDVASTGEAGIDLNNVNVPAGPIPFLGIVDNGTAQSATGTTLVTRAANPDNSIQSGMTLFAYGSTQGYWQSVIIDSVSTDTLTIAAWPLATPSGTITYYVQGTPNGSPNLLPSVHVLTVAANAVTASALATDAVSEIQSGLALAADLATVAGYLDTEIAAILADTNELQTDWANGGRLDLILDARASQTSVDDIPTVAEFEARTPTAAQLAYIVANAATGLPVTFTTSGGSTTAAVLALVDGGSPSATNDQYNGRLLVFTDGTLKGVVTDITDYVGGTTTATITAIPTAPTSSHNARLI